MRLTPRFPLLVLLVCLLVITGLTFSSYLSLAAETTGADKLVAGVKGHEFVANQTCIECHTAEAQAWQGSQHDKAMQVATAETVLGDFKDASFTDAGVTSRFFQKDGKYFVNTAGEDGKLADFEVKYTFGVKPLQQYLLALPKGRLQAFTVAWDTQKNQWFDLYPNEKIPPESPLYWTQRAFTANSSCIECHTTNMSLKFDVQKREYHTTWNEANVSCQACHGPGSQHVTWAKALTDKPTTQDKAGKTDNGLLVNYRQMDAKGVVETCAACHSRRHPVSENDALGQPFLDDFMPELLREGMYHANGLMQDEVFNYGSFVQSKMYHKGVSCNDCHNPHTLKLRAEGNAMCATCHQAEAPRDRFPSLTPKAYDTPEHHFHKAGSTGAQCVSCHMPTTTYMQVDPRHDHSFSIPRPDLSDKWGTPNACTGCHTEQSATWAVTAMEKWYGKSWQQRPNVAGLLTQARGGAPEALSPLIEVINNPEQAAIIRATAVDSLSRYGQAGMEAMMDSLKDTSPLVRASALQGLGNTLDPNRVKTVLKSLGDPVRAVRIEAARLLVATPKEQFSDTEWQQQQQALEEYKSAQLALADHPEGHVNLGNLYARMGQAEPAQQAYQTAISLDAHFAPAYQALGQLYYATQRQPEAIATFQQGLAQIPNNAELHYALALLLVEQHQMEQGLVHLGKAASFAPDQAQIHYNYGLLLQQQQRLSEAEQALLQANRLSPTDPRTLQALAALYQKQGLDGKAQPFIQQLRAIQTGSQP